MSFVEERLERGYDKGAVGGHEYATTVVVTSSGREQRNQRWSASLGRWQLGQRNIQKSELEYLTAFHRARRGQLIGFRFKDWNDFQAEDEEIVIDGSPTAQLIKTYSTGTGDDYVRTITKPVAGATFERGASPYAPALDTTNGVVTFTPDSTASISNITQANPASVTATAHGFGNGDEIYISGVAGMTEVNGNVYTITVVDPDTFTLGIDSTAFTAYSSGGTAGKYPQSSETVTWSGEFDVPVRFDQDTFNAEFRAWQTAPENAIYALGAIGVTEIRAT